MSESPYPTDRDIEALVRHVEFLRLEAVEEVAATLHTDEGKNLTVEQIHALGEWGAAIQSIRDAIAFRKSI